MTKKGLILHFCIKAPNFQILLLDMPNLEKCPETRMRGPDFKENEAPKGVPRKSENIIVLYNLVKKYANKYISSPHYADNTT